MITTSWYMGSFANGEEDNEVQIEVSELIGKGLQATLSLNHSVVTETNNYSSEASKIDVTGLDELSTEALASTFGMYANESTSEHIGRYQENWDDGVGEDGLTVDLSITTIKKQLL